MYNLIKIMAFILIFSASNLGFAQDLTAAELEEKLNNLEIEIRTKKLNYKEVHQKLLPLIEQGNAQVQNFLGDLLYKYYDDDDDASTQDVFAAEKWYKLAANQNLIKAELNLGNFYKRVADGIYMFNLWHEYNYYKNNESSKKNKNKKYLVALNQRWRELALEQGNKAITANTNMLDKYRRKADNEFYKESLKWFTKLAAQNNAEGQYNLCHLYAGGLGVKKDFLQAIKWCQLAEAQNYEDATDMLRYIKQTQELCSDPKRVEEYKNQHPFFYKPDC